MSIERAHRVFDQDEFISLISLYLPTARAMRRSGIRTCFRILSLSIHVHHEPCFFAIL